MDNKISPNISELEFLNLSYNRFFDIYDQVIKDSFWEKDDWERFSKISQAFSIYAELLNYEPINQVIQKLKTIRPSMESEIGSELFKFVRNIIAHFPFFTAWNDIWVSKSLINWYKDGQTIDKFLKKYESHPEVKYRLWESDKKRMTYVTISFPNSYSDGSKIYLKNMITEREGILFSFVLMKQILGIQVEYIKEV